MKKLSFVASALCMVGTANAGIPFFNATCPGNIEVHADQGGPVFFNGKKGIIKKSQASYYEVAGAGITLSIAINPDGSPLLTYTGKRGANGVCTLSEGNTSSTGGTDAPPTAESNSGSGKPISPGNMPAYCRGEAAGQFGTKPMYIKTGKLTRMQNGGYAIKGVGDLGNQGEKPFQCEFDKQGKFLHFKSLVDEGRL